MAAAQATMTPGENDNDATFTLKDEDHTLGNALRFALNKNPHVAFCGYSVLHPSSNMLNVRVQTTGEMSAAEAFRQALKDVISICEHVRASFDAAVDAHKKAKAEKATEMEED